MLIYQYQNDMNAGHNFQYLTIQSLEKDLPEIAAIISTNSESLKRQLEKNQNHNKGKNEKEKKLILARIPTDY